jgi:hypothetical protein
MKVGTSFLPREGETKRYPLSDSYIAKSENLSLSPSDMPPEISPPLVGGD